MRRLYRFLLRVNCIIFIALAVLICLMIDFAGTSLPISESISSPDEIKALQEMGPWLFFLLAVWVVPFLETFFFQAFIIHLSARLFRWVNLRSIYLPVTISAIAFGLWHHYNLTFIILRFSGGFVLAFFYTIAHRRKETGILLTTAIHSVLNLIPFISDYFLQE